MEVNVCIPTLKRYDLLNKLIISLKKSSVKPTTIYIIDNGRNFKTKETDFDIRIYRPEYNIGVAASWNWFINNVPEIRIICNDDLEFTPFAIERLILGYDEDHVVFPHGLESSLNTFSCFTISDKLVKEVGYFDETISPNYAYFEDNDYRYRLILAGYNTKKIWDSIVSHTRSSTINAFGNKELREHHKKFETAKSNYLKKWGGLPEEEKYLTPYNR